MKKLLPTAVLAASLALVGLAACSSDSPSGPARDAGPPPPPVATVDLPPDGIGGPGATFPLYVKSLVEDRTTATEVPQTEAQFKKPVNSDDPKAFEPKFFF